MVSHVYLLCGRGTSIFLIEFIANTSIIYTDGSDGAKEVI